MLGPQETAYAQKQDPRFGGTTDGSAQRQTIFGELADRSRGQNSRLECYVGNLERLIERLTGNGQGGLADSPDKPAFAAITEIGETFEQRARLLDRLENACNQLESLA